MEIAFALDTFYAVMSGALVMFMAAGFTMLEAGLVQKKDVSEIVTKNIGLYSIACIMYLVCGFMVMYLQNIQILCTFLYVLSVFHNLLLR